MALSGNTSANLADYTLSFDLARIGTGGGYFVAFNTFNEGSAPGSGTGVEYDIFGVPASGAGYQHFSVNMDTLNPTYGASAKLDPTGSQIYFELVALGFPPNEPSSPETLLLDNVKITMVPEPNTFAMLLGGLGLLAGWRRLRRVP